MKRKQLNWPAEKPLRWIEGSSPRYLAALEHVCNGMRETERRQHLAFLAPEPGAPAIEYCARTAAMIFANKTGLSGYYVDESGMPVCAGGWEFGGLPGVRSSWMVASDAGWERYWLDLTRGTRWTMRKLFEGGARRLETCAIEERTEAQRWFRDFLGMTYEGARRGYCTDGQDLRMYSMTAADFAAQMRAGDDGR